MKVLSIKQKIIPVSYSDYVWIGRTSTEEELKKDIIKMFLKDLN